MLTSFPTSTPRRFEMPDTYPVPMACQPSRFVSLTHHTKTPFVPNTLSSAI